MNELKKLTKQNFTIPYKCIGIVLDNKDPLDRGRLKVRIPEIIDDSVIDTDCPWAETMMDLFGSSNTTVGFSSVPKIGSYVYVEFLYHNPSYPIVCGVVRGNKDSAFVHTGKNLGSTVSGLRTSNLTGPELPPLNSSTVYPNNNVIETDSAVIELDDTPGNERIAIQHKNGSYFEIRPNGDVQFRALGKQFNVTNDDLEIFAGGDIRIMSNKDIFLVGKNIWLN